MNPLEAVKANFDNWNRHDADAIAAAYTADGVYIHPVPPEPLVGGPAVADFARGVFGIFPDFALDLISIDATERGLVTLQWVYHGTDTGPHPDGRAPSGRYIRCPGVSVVQVEGDKLKSERVYFDRLDEYKQFGIITDEQLAPPAVAEQAQS